MPIVVLVIATIRKVSSSMDTRNRVLAMAVPLVGLMLGSRGVPDMIKISCLHGSRRSPVSAGYSRSSVVNRVDRGNKATAVTLSKAATGQEATHSKDMELGIPSNNLDMEGILHRDTEGAMGSSLHENMA